MRNFRNKNHYNDNEPNLFSNPTPLELPSLERAQLTNKLTFLEDSKETLGLVAKVNKTIVEKVVRGESPNYSLSKFLNEVTRTLSLSMTSYISLLDIESKQIESNDIPRVINITQKPLD